MAKWTWRDSSSVRTPPLHLIFRLQLPGLAVVIGRLIAPHERVGADIVERPSRLFAAEIRRLEHVPIVAHGPAGKSGDRTVLRIDEGRAPCFSLRIEPV